MRKLKLNELGRKSLPDFKIAAKLPLMAVLDDVRSLNNVGSIFRTADAFLLERLYLCGITGQPPQPEIHKTALGATESVAWEYAPTVEALLLRLKGEGCFIAVLEQTDASIALDAFIASWPILPNQKLVVVLGNEIRGVNDAALALADAAIELPQYGTKHSLNISVAAGIALYALSQKMRSPG